MLSCLIESFLHLQQIGLKKIFTFFGYIHTPSFSVSVAQSLHGFSASEPLVYLGLTYGFIIISVAFMPAFDLRCPANATHSGAHLTSGCQTHSADEADTDLDELSVTFPNPEALLHLPWLAWDACLTNCICCPQNDLNFHRISH